MCTEPHAIQRNNSEKWQQREEREVSGRKKKPRGEAGIRWQKNLFIFIYL